MKKRGKVVRDTSVGAGLLSIGGKQYAFELEGNWKSDLAPRVNMDVDIEFDADDQVVSVQMVPPSQLMREQAEGAMTIAKRDGARFGRQLAGRFGIDTLVAMAMLLCGWFVFNTVSVQISEGYGTGLTFWKILAVVNSPMGIMNAFGSSGGGTGFYGFLAIVALAGPLAPFFLKDKRAHLGGALPLIFMLAICLSIYFGISDSVKQAQGMAGTIGGQQAAQMASEMASAMVRQVMHAISLGLGCYIAAIASVYFAGRGVIAFLNARA